jgi:hypothetical protein
MFRTSCRKCLPVVLSVLTATISCFNDFVLARVLSRLEIIWSLLFSDFPSKPSAQNDFSMCPSLREGASVALLRLYLPAAALLGADRPADVWISCF